MKVITADQVGPLVPDEATIFLGGLAVTSLPEEILQGLERHFLATGHPRMVSTWACGAVGNSGDAGMKHFAHPGMIKRVVAGHFGQTGKEMMKMVFDGEVEAYNFPQGSLSHLTRQIANRSPGLLTQVGLGTFVDPRQEGGRMNPRSTAPLVKLVEFDGQEWLHYPSPKIDVAIIRGTVADERGNITLDKEGVILEQLSIAQAAKRWGGTVIVQVERIVKAGTLHPKAVKVPGFLVDYVVVAKPENHMQTITTQFDPALCGDIRVPVGSLAAMPLDERKVIARRAALEVHAGKLSNLGIGIPAGIPAVAAEEGVADRLTLSIESGVNGGVPAQLGDFGLAYNAESIIEQSFQFDFYDGGGLDASFLGLAQTDAQGNVNVSKFNGRPVGCGGFINITRSTPNLVFCGAFTAGGLEVAIGDGQLKIVKEGRNPKFIAQVEQITFNGKDAAARRQNVTFVTERAVFKLREDGLELVEIAPGIDLERDVLAHMAFKPLMRDVKRMDAGIFSERWGGLAKRWAEHLLKRAAAAAAGPATPDGELHEAELHTLLGYQVAQAKIATDAVFDRTVGEPHELRPVEYTMLALIAANPGASPGRIATALALNKPNVTLWLDRLESRRLVERRPSAQDGRSIELSVTAAGAKLHAAGTAALVEGERLAFDRLSPAERAMLAELLHKLAARR